MYHDPNPNTHRDGMMQDPPYHMARDPREGKSGERRKMYMDGKGYKDKSKQMQELEQYMQELANDMSEMIQDASSEEKQLLQQKIATLAAKIK
jgi:DNA modification methylase